MCRFNPIFLVAATVPRSCWVTGKGFLCRSWVLDCRGLVESLVHKSPQTATSVLPLYGKPKEPGIDWRQQQLAVNPGVVELLGPELVLLSVSQVLLVLDHLEVPVSFWQEPSCIMVGKIVIPNPATTPVVSRSATVIGINQATASAIVTSTSLTLS